MISLPVAPVDSVSADQPKVVIGTLEPLAVDSEQFAALIGVSRAMFFKLIDSGRVGPIGIKLGKCVRYPLAEVRAWVDAGMPHRQKWLALRKNGT